MTALHITTFKFKNWFFIGHTCKQASKALDLLISFVLSPKCPTPKSGMIEFCYIQWIINIIHTANKEFNSFQKKRVTLCVNAMMAPTAVTRNHSFNTLQMVSSPFFALVQKFFAPQYFCVQKNTFENIVNFKSEVNWILLPFPDMQDYSPWFQISGSADTGQGRKHVVLNFDLEPFFIITKKKWSNLKGESGEKINFF